MRTVEQIVEQIRAAAGADFAFVLTRKGRLVTHRAPRDMPEEGRERLVRAARPIVGTDQVIEVTMPREELVPYGGAAPVDVYVGVVAEQAIVCVVMASWAEKIRVQDALEAGLPTIAPLLRRGVHNARRAPADAEPARGSRYVRERDTVHPPAEVAYAPPLPLPRAPMPTIDLRASLIPDIPRVASLPEIAIGEAPLGRESLVAVRRDAAGGGPAPDITVGEAPLGRESLVAVRRDAATGGSAPEITMSQAPLGRESMMAIEHATELDAPESEDVPRKRPSSTPDAIRVELVSLPDVELVHDPRATLPWVEAPPDAKRASDAARLGRKLASPKVTIKLEDAADVDAALRETAKRS